MRFFAEVLHWQMNFQGIKGNLGLTSFSSHFIPHIACLNWENPLLTFFFFLQLKLPFTKLIFWYFVLLVTVQTIFLQYKTFLIQWLKENFFKTSFIGLYLRDKSSGLQWLIVPQKNIQPVLRTKKLLFFQ